MTLARLTLAVRVLSRPADEGRRARIRAIMPEGLDWSFFDATDGKRPETIPPAYARLVAPTFWGGRDLKPGAIGCFLSHYRLWEHCAGEGRPLLVLEDDVAFAPDTRATVDTILRNSHDVLFVNARTSDWVQTWRRLGGAPERVTRVASLVPALVAAGAVPRAAVGAGTDGYVVTPAGAAKLVALADTSGTAMGVDWFMIASALAGAALDGSWSVPAKAARLLPAGEAVDVAIAARWLVREAREVVPVSVIDHGDVVPAEVYRARLSRG